MSKMEEAVPAGPVLALAKRLKTQIESLGARVEICGSLRRERPLVKDIDLITNLSTWKVTEHLGEYIDYIGLVYTQTSCGNKRLSAMIGQMPFQIIVIPEESWGAGLLHATGSKLFNILLRYRAKEQGMKLNQYGLYCSGEMVASKTEEQIMQVLGYSFIPPQNRDKGLFKI